MSAVKLCEHLAPVLVHELARGNVVKEIHENAFTNAVVVIDLEKTMDVNQANILVKKLNFVSYFETSDYHFELQRGYFCEHCKHALAGPK
ncbi:hypothetical protein [Dendrosporobacter sp. 1207_IL3150]|uniref:hypothetical protein n=1 Tax=Dendrosporobacter sp. 1207_IL3150 TaxID=3084054 RepID=UPI002FDAA4EF